MTIQEHEPLVRKWLLMLIACGVGNCSADETAARIDVAAPILADLFGAECFNRRSLAEAASRIKFFPTVADVADALRAWAWEERWQQSAAMMGMDGYGGTAARVAA